MKHGIFLGLSTIDIINYVSHYPLKNEKLKVNKQLYFAGGPATNAAIAFASFGNKCTLITGMGNHPVTGLAKKDIKSHNVELKVPEIEVVDTLGSGDIFHGAFCHFILQDNDFIKSLEKATQIAGLSCTFYGTRKWIEKIQDFR